MSALVLAVILIAGYHYQSKHPIRRMELARSTGYHIYFKAGISGIVLLFSSSILWFFIDLFNFPSCIIEFFSSKENLTYLKSQDNWGYFKAAAVAVLMLLFSEMYCRVSKWHYNGNVGKRYRRVLRIASDLERLLIESTYDQSFTRIELDCGKVYVGVAQEVDLEGGEVTYVTILPFLSGHRDIDNKLIFSISYQRHYDYIEKALESSAHNIEDYVNKFHIVLPVKQITIASRFDVDAYVDMQSMDSRPKPFKK